MEIATVTATRRAIIRTAADAVLTAKGIDEPTTAQRRNAEKAVRRALRRDGSFEPRRTIFTATEIVRRERRDFLTAAGEAIISAA